MTSQHRDFDDSCKPRCPPQIISTIYPTCWVCKKNLKGIYETVELDKAQAELSRRKFA